MVHEINGIGLYNISKDCYMYLIKVVHYKAFLLVGFVSKKHV